MKVVCIDAGFKKEALLNGGDAKGLVEGNIYTVIRIIPPIRKTEGYLLEEVKSDHQTGAFLASRFAPISEIDEIEMEREYNLQMQSPFTTK